MITNFPAYTANLPICEIPYLRNNQWEPRTGSLVDHLNRWGWTETRDKSACRLWSPITLKAGCTKRCIESVETVTALVLDFDDGTTLDEAAAKIPCAWMAHSSHSHTADNPRFRMILPISRPIPAGEWRGFWEECVKEFAPNVDKACKDPSRIYYTPSRRPNLGYGEFFEAYSACDWLGSPSEHIDPLIGVITATHERGVLDVEPYLLAAAHAKQMAGIRKQAQIVPTLQATAGKDWATFDPRAWAASMGLKTLEGTARLWVECPWAANHSDPSKDTIKDAYFRLDESPHWFGCSHAHCHDKKLQHIMREMRGEDFCK